MRRQSERRHCQKRLAIAAVGYRVAPLLEQRSAELLHEPMQPLLADNGARRGWAGPSVFELGSDAHGLACRPLADYDEVALGVVILGIHASTHTIYDLR